MIIKKILVALNILVLFLVSLGCANNQIPRTEIYVSAPSSLTDALQQVKTAFETEHKQIHLIMNFASSGTIKTQLEQGAPADLFISAANEQMDELVTKNLIDAESTMNLLSNRMVIIAPLETDYTMNGIEDLLNPPIQKIALGEPEIVPSGQYAKEILTHYDLWEKGNNKFIFTKDVRQALAYVETGNVDAGFVYSTDAAISKNSRLLFTPQEDSYTTIQYPMGIVSSSNHKKEAEELFDFLMSDPILRIFENYGFTVLAP